MRTIRLFRLVERLLSGAILPLFLFPGWFSSALRYLPFGYTLYVPVQALIQPQAPGDLGASLGIGLAWCVALGWATRAMTAAGWRRFTAHGT
jgi:ABC-2 type transport system permease protein